MSAKPWAEPGLSVEERARLVSSDEVRCYYAGGFVAQRIAVAEALRAAEADAYAYARGKADGAAVPFEPARPVEPDPTS